jgi:hypothetical protein
MMPPDDSTVAVMLPEPVATGADKSVGSGPAGAAADLETIVDLPAPITSFADAAAQYRRASRSENTRRAYRAADGALLLSTRRRGMRRWRRSSSPICGA